MNREEKVYRQDARRNGRDVIKCLSEIERHKRGVEQMKARIAEGTTSEGGFGSISRELAEKALALHERGIENNAAWAYASAVRAGTYALLSIESRG